MYVLHLKQTETHQKKTLDLTVSAREDVAAKQNTREVFLTNLCRGSGGSRTGPAAGGAAEAASLPRHSRGPLHPRPSPYKRFANALTAS